MNQTKKELSYFRLKLEGYLRDHHPELMADSAFIGARADLALSSYCDSVAQGFSHLEAEAMASEILYQGLHFSKYDTLVSILEQEFSEERPEPLPHTHDFRQNHRGDHTLRRPLEWTCCPRG